MNVSGTAVGSPVPIATAPPTLTRYVLRLYVTGTSARSERAIANAKQVCETYLANRYHLDIVDIYQDPAAAREHQIVAAPTLVRVEPAPVRRLIGDLSDRARVLAGLDLAHPVPGAR